MDPRKRKRLLVALTIGVIALALWFFLLRSTEPTYNGRRLSEWVEVHGRGSPEERRQAAAAIQAIGTNTLPHLLAWTDSEIAAPWRLKLASLTMNLPDWILRYRIFRPLTNPGGDDRKAFSIEAFGALGSLASPALGELERRIYITNSIERRDTALLALSRIGQPAVPVLLEALTDPGMADSLAPVVSLHAADSNLVAAVPILVQRLGSTNIAVACVGARGLGYLRLEPELAVPALAAALNDTRDTIRFLSAQALSKFGSNAQSALPALTNRLGDADPIVQAHARIAIKAITGVAPP